MEKPARARERYQLKIELIDVDDSMRASAVLGKLILASTRLGAVVTIAREFQRESLPPSGPQARVITVTDRASKKNVAQFAIDAGEAGQAVAKEIHFEYLRHDADVWADKWIRPPA